MTQKAPTKSRISSLVAPSAEDDAAWAAMTREQQLEVLRELALAPDTGTASGKTAAQILTETRARRSKANG